MTHHEESGVEHHSAGYGIYIIIWMALVVFTGITVVVAGINLQAFTVPMALGIAAIKTSLVVLFFMHIRYEPPLFKAMLFICCITFVIFISLTFFDFAFRF